jgi:hypothetical protein
MRKLALFAALLAAGAAVVASAQTLPPATQLRTGAAPLAATPAATKFTFVVAGDNRPAKPTLPLTQPLLDIAGRLAAAPPAFVVWNGDAVFGKGVAGLSGQYAAFRDAMKKVPVPLFNAPGNHEMVVQTNIPCGTAASPWNAEVPDYSGAMPAQYAESIGAPYGMFHYGNAAFLLLNTDDAPDVPIPTACDYNGFVGQAQLTALQNTLTQLSADATVTHIFLFMHRPIHDDNFAQFGGQGTSDYAQRLAQFSAAIDNASHPKVTFVFASHDHRLYVYPPPAAANGPWTGSVPATAAPTFIVTGGAGAPLTGCRNGSGPAGSYFHYVSVAVDGPNVTVTVNPLYGTTPCSVNAASAPPLASPPPAPAPSSPR